MENLVVASKVKALIKKSGEMNTSASAIEELSKLVENHCMTAIENARKSKRKTVMDRDFHE